MKLVDTNRPTNQPTDRQTLPRIELLSQLKTFLRDFRNTQFRFRVVKRCKTALERQVREAVRIERRGNVQNKKGMFNRCKLTRMVVDKEGQRGRNIILSMPTKSKPEVEGGGGFYQYPRVMNSSVEICLVVTLG